MSFERYKIKMEAKSQLKTENNFWKAALALGITALLMLIVNLLSNASVSASKISSLGATSQLQLNLLYLLLCIILLLIFWPLFLGVTRWFFLSAQGKSISFSEIFYYYRSFKLFFRGVGSIIVAIITIAIVFLIMIPTMLITLGTVFFSVASSVASSADALLHGNPLYAASYFESIGMFGIFLSFLIIVGGLILSMLIVLKFFLADYFIVSDDSIPIMDCIGMSFKAMKRNLWSVFWLMLSFLGWTLLAVVILIVCAILFSPFLSSQVGLGDILIDILAVVIILPLEIYYNMTMATCANWLINKHHKEG